MLDCFVIMPFGEKRGQDGLVLDFDQIYEQLIEPAIQKANMTPIRSDRFHGSHGIMASMMEQLVHAPVALMDATFFNPNAFYELGVRHAFRRKLTVAIKAEGHSVPYDVRDVPFFTYPLVGREVANLEKTIDQLAFHIDQSLKNVALDSPVLDNLPDSKPPSRDGRAIEASESILFDYNAAEDTKIGIRTGDLRHVRNVDGWVNSENDLFQMARVVDRSISGAIRYLGARVNAVGDVERDQIAENLEKAVRKAMNVRRGTMPRCALGQVVDTAAGRLGESHNVKRIFHVVTVRSTYMRGVEPGADVSQYVENVVCEVDAFNRDRRRSREGKIESILIPIFGTGMGGGTVEVVSDQLVSGAIRGIDRVIENQSETRLKRIEFLAFGTRALEALELSFNKQHQLGRIGDRSGPPIGSIT